MRRKVCMVTGTRAEYGLLQTLMEKIRDSDDLELQLLVTGMHLSPEFGLTYRQIEEDGFRIDRKVEMLLSSDTPVGIAKSMGLGMIGFADALAELKPDLLVVLGDRFEVFAVASAAMVLRLPVAHLYGGEATEGLIDEPIRHSITKMSHLHFTSTKVYRNRVIQLGEQPDHVFNVGALGVDNIKRIPLLGRKAFEESIGFRLAEKNFLITFHPVTLESATAEEQFSAVLEALDELQDTHLIFTKSNADTDGRVINSMIDAYVGKHPEKAVEFTSLGQLRYLSALSHVDGVIGNSSSGIIEAPSFKVGTVNIGDRQRGRVTCPSIIDCGPAAGEIRDAIAKLFSDDFRKILASVESPYGDGTAAEQILQVIRLCSLDGILKKSFYDFEEIH